MNATTQAPRPLQVLPIMFGAFVSGMVLLPLLFVMLMFLSSYPSRARFETFVGKAAAGQG